MPLYQESLLQYPNEEPSTIFKDLEPLSVQALSSSIKLLLETGYKNIKVKGEISDCKLNSSGHLYFTIKDDKANLSCVVWRSGIVNLLNKPKDGLEVICTGTVSTFAGQSKYQLVVKQIELAGIGEKLKAKEELRRKLLAEGLFDDSRKKPLPYLPENIGVITSNTGAVIKDIMHRITDRFPVPVWLWSVKVQGQTCPHEVVEAIKGFNSIPKEGLDTPSGKIPRPDVIIVARGGGSIDDLWGFNDELVVRATAASNIPIISAVGHETDTTLIDFASSLRAPTPTGAAEKAVPVLAEEVLKLEDKSRRLFQALKKLIDNNEKILSSNNLTLPSLEKIINEHLQYLEDKSERLENSLRFYCDKCELKLKQINLNEPILKINQCEKDLIKVAPCLDNYFKDIVRKYETNLNRYSDLLDSYSYERVLERGFAIVQDKDGNIISNVKIAKEKKILDIQFVDGKISASVDNLSKENSKKELKKKNSLENLQGNLFDV